MTLFTAQRIAGDGLSSVARLATGEGAALCFCLEPGKERPSHPAIAGGNYALRLRTDGEKHAEYNRYYSAKFGIGWHRGMIELVDVPGRAAILFHCGNTIADTEGCFLAGENFLQPPGNGSGHYEVVRSRAAYERVYPILRDAAARGGAMLSIRDAEAQV